MLKRISGTLWVYIGILLFSCLILYQSFQLRYLFSKIVPIIICVMVVLLTLLGIAVETYSIAKGKSRTRSAVAGEKKVEKTEKSMFECTAAVFIFAFLIIAVGFLVAVPLFMLAYIKLNGGKLSTAIISAVSVTLFVHVMFNMVLDADLYHGKLFMLLGY